MVFPTGGATFYYFCSSGHSHASHKGGEKSGTIPMASSRLNVLSCSSCQSWPYAATHLSSEHVDSVGKILKCSHFLREKSQSLQPDVQILIWFCSFLVGSVSSRTCPPYAQFPSLSQHCLLSSPCPSTKLTYCPKGLLSHRYPPGIGSCNSFLKDTFSTVPTHTKIFPPPHHIAFINVIHL